MHAQKTSRTIYLHIGTEKTGTTTLQALASSNRALLAAHGVCYPLTPGDANHIGLTVFAKEPDSIAQDLTSSLKLYGPEAVGAYRDNFLARLGAEIDASGRDKILFSNEHMSSRLRKPAPVERLVAGLRSIADDVRVIVYLRPQHELVLSAYSTAIKSGNTYGLKLDQGENNFFFNYDKMLSLWEGVVGQQNIDVRVFGRDRFHGGSLVADFFHALGMATPQGVVVPEDHNRALDAETVEFLRAANEIYPRFVDGKLSPQRNRMLTILEEMSHGPRISAPFESLARIHGVFAESNRRVAARYFGSPDAPMFPPLVQNGPAEPPGLSTQRAIELGVALWKQRGKP